MSTPHIDIFVVKSKKDPTQKVTASNLSVTLYWNYDIYQCEILPHKLNKHYYCNEQNTVISNITSNTAKYSISLEYNSPNKILIDSISVTPSPNKNVSFSIDLFCAPWQYDHFKYSITAKRWNTCNTQLPIEGTNHFKMPQLDNIGIGQGAGITKHTFNFVDILNYPNQATEGIVSVPKVTAFGIKVAGPWYPKDWDPQTREPITLSLYWYDTFYQCIVHPIEINGTYLCHVNDTQITSSCDIDKWHYGQFSLFMEKQLNTDALVIDQVIVYDETGTWYGINHFCIDSWDMNTADICKSSKDKSKKGPCSGYLWTNIDTKSPSEYVGCKGTCIDADGCGRNRLFYHFPYDLYKHNNSYMQAVTASGILHTSGTCDASHSLHFINTINKDASLYNDANHRYIGCYIDEGGNGRTMEPIKSDGTFIGCSKACNAYAYKYFALQNNDQCFCGNVLSEIKKYGKYDGTMGESQHRSHCHNDGKHMIGGYWTNAVYRQNEGAESDVEDIPQQIIISATKEPLMNSTSEINTTYYHRYTETNEQLQQVKHQINAMMIILGVMLAVIFCIGVYILCEYRKMNTVIDKAESIFTEEENEMPISDDGHSHLGSEDQDVWEIIDKQDVEQKMEEEIEHQIDPDLELIVNELVEDNDVYLRQYQIINNGNIKHMSKKPMPGQ